ncbi:hypothetical protein QVD17_27553 [Tagetes erecta]|uniref:Uncharacterized protein n=1 Tax=Tagetes erecta TaxID=13708 RepID=A0AAD8K9A5_TARER|nr:hypothetical protein QVD17_27553 [Tagetes erecta]
MSKNHAFCSYDDARPRFKHQILVQDYMDLHQETEAARNKLMALKQKKLTLQAEVRFLRRRHKFLSENKSSTLQEQVFMNPKPARFRKSNKEKVHIEKQKTLHNLLPAGKKKIPQSMPSLEFDTILEDSLHGVKQQPVQRVIANQRVRINGPKAPRFLDSSHKDVIFGNQIQEPSCQTRKPVIDLNQISSSLEREEEEVQERFDPVTQGLIRNGVDTDARLSIIRNVGKRKVSWQDPVAVRV